MLTPPRRTRFRLGPSTAVAQIYQPRLVVFESAGPFHVEQGGLTGDASWSGLQGSFHGASDGFTRASLVIDGPKVTVAGAVISAETPPDPTGSTAMFADAR